LRRRKEGGLPESNPPYVAVAVFSGSVPHMNKSLLVLFSKKNRFLQSKKQNLTTKTPRHEGFREEKKN